MTAYLQGHFSFVVFQVTDKVQRLNLESRIISTISWCDGCGPLDGWLGLSSPLEKIRESGLWLVNELRKEPLSDAELEILKDLMSI